MKSRHKQETITRIQQFTMGQQKDRQEAVVHVHARPGHFIEDGAFPRRSASVLYLCRTPNVTFPGFPFSKDRQVVTKWSPNVTIERAPSRPAQGSSAPRQPAPDDQHRKGQRLADLHPEGEKDRTTRGLEPFARKSTWRQNHANSRTRDVASISNSPSAIYVVKA